MIASLEVMPPPVSPVDGVVRIRVLSSFTEQVHPATCDPAMKSSSRSALPESKGRPLETS